MEEQQPLPGEPDETEAAHEALMAEILATRPATPPEMEALLSRHFDLDTQLGFARQLIYQAADAICVTDRQGRLSLVNRAFCKLVEKPMQEVLGRDVAEVISERRRGRLRRRWSG